MKTPRLPSTLMQWSSSSKFYPLCVHHCPHYVHIYTWTNINMYHTLLLKIFSYHTCRKCTFISLCQLYQYPASHPMTAGISSSAHPNDPELDQVGIENGWMNGSEMLLTEMCNNKLFWYIKFVCIMYNTWLEKYTALIILYSMPRWGLWAFLWAAGCPELTIAKLRGTDGCSVSLSFSTGLLSLALNLHPALAMGA